MGQGLVKGRLGPVEMADMSGIADQAGKRAPYITHSSVVKRQMLPRMANF